MILLRIHWFYPYLCLYNFLSLDKVFFPFVSLWHLSFTQNYTLKRKSRYPILNLLHSFGLDSKREKKTNSRRLKKVKTFLLVFFAYILYRLNCALEKSSTVVPSNYIKRNEVKRKKYFFYFSFIMLAKYIEFLFENKFCNFLNIFWLIFKKNKKKLGKRVLNGQFKKQLKSFFFFSEIENILIKNIELFFCYIFLFVFLFKIISILTFIKAGTIKSKIILTSNSTLFLMLNQFFCFRSVIVALIKNWEGGKKGDVNNTFP